MADTSKCELCGEPMPAGEEVFKFHGYSGPCPKPPLPKEDDVVTIKGILLAKKGDHIVVEAWMPDGTYREVIRERAEGPISHCVHAAAISKSIDQKTVTPGVSGQAPA